MADSKSTSKSRNFSTRYESALLKICDRVGSHLTQKDIHLVTVLSGTGLDDSLKRKIKNGKDLLLALSKTGYCDESNFSSIIDLLKIIKRHDLIHMVQIRQKTKVTLDPVEEYLKNISQVPSKCRIIR
ncbi:death effector domain-containing protein [Caerostris extrusa]|uniref:Death effector domain-containing protein n=1 Tax=Caerostris extrusa TaxID=172846 RepID=A0AAV4RJT9_CAEEX|nr:death effector domain-containing protein [Caerostris extrusa]